MTRTNRVIPGTTKAATPKRMAARPLRARAHQFLERTGSIGLPAAVLALVVMTLLLSSFHSIGAAWITDRFADPEVPVLRSKVLYKAFTKHRYQPYHPLYHASSSPHRLPQLPRPCLQARGTPGLPLRSRRRAGF